MARPRPKKATMRRTKVGADDRRTLRNRSRIPPTSAERRARRVAPARRGSSQAHSADQAADLHSMRLPFCNASSSVRLLVYTYVNVILLVKDFVSFDLIALMCHYLATHIKER